MHIPDTCKTDGGVGPQTDRKSDRQTDRYTLIYNMDSRNKNCFDMFSRSWTSCSNPMQPRQTLAKVSLQYGLMLSRKEALRTVTKAEDRPTQLVSFTLEDKLNTA